MKHVLTILIFTAALSMAAGKKLVTIQTPSGEVTYKEGAIPNQSSFDDSVAELTPDEITALERDSKRGQAFILAFVAPEDRTGDTLEDLDVAFASWLRSGKRDAFTTTDVVRIVGCALGSRSIQQLGVRWARVTDAHGTDIALVADEPPTRSFPFTSVQYRIEDNQTDFIVALFRTLEHAMKPKKK